MICVLKNESSFIDNLIVGFIVHVVQVNFWMIVRMQLLSTANNYELASMMTLSFTYIILNHLDNLAEKVH